MRILFIIITIITLSGCETLGNMVKENTYTLQIHETPYSRQMFGYNTDYEYVGFMISGSFGEKGIHTHSDACEHLTFSK